MATEIDAPVMGYDMKAALQTQVDVADRLRSLAARTKADVVGIATSINERGGEEQIEFAADLTDFLGAHFEQGDFLNTEVRLENLYSSLVLHPNPDVTTQHIDVFAVAAIHAYELVGDKEARERIEAARHTALRVRKADFPLPVEVVPVETVVQTVELGKPVVDTVSI